MKVEFAAHAIHRLHAIHEYIAADSPHNAAGLIDRIIDRAESLAQHPMRGRRAPEYAHEEIREIREPPYRIIYRVGADMVQVLTVMHEHELLPVDLVLDPRRET